MVIAQVDCRDNNITAVRLGAQIPLFDTSSGRVLAAWMDEAALARLLEEADEGTAERRRAFVEDLPRVRAAGYAENPSLTIEGVLNISAPIRDISGRVVAAATVPFVRRLSGTSIATVDQCRTEVLDMAARISRQLGAGATV
jgi:DNA-binding IclR family transcriptional regulator